MRATVKALLGALPIALLLAAVTTATASAEACHKEAGSKKYTACFEGQQLGSATETKTENLSGHLKTGTVARLNGKSLAFATGAAPVTCPTVEALSNLSSGKGKASLTGMELKFRNCAYESTEFSKKCSISNPITFRTFEGRLAAGTAALNLFATGGAQVAEFSVLQRSGCPASMLGTYKINAATNVLGERLGPECTLPEVEVEKVEHEIKCLGASHLVINETSVELGFEEMVEAFNERKGQKFSIIESS